MMGRPFIDVHSFGWQMVLLMRYTLFMRILLKTCPLLFVFMLQGCFSNIHDFDTLQAPWGEEASYRTVAMEFVQDAQAGEVDKMLAISSSLSTPPTGSLRDFYLQQVIPEFQQASVKWDDHAIANRDERNNWGLAFKGHVHGKKAYVFQVAVEKENDKPVVINISKVQ